MPKKRKRPGRPSPGKAKMAAGERIGASGPRAKAEVAESAAGDAPHAERSSLVVVGVGASAGGLDAFTQLLHHLPAESGAAFVFVQHLDPKHESILPSLLARATTMPVREAADYTRLEADHVYVIPAHMDIAIAGGHLRLVPRPATRGPHMPLDFFLSTLAQAQGSRAIGVILSGTGSDGTLGVKAVKAAGGIAFAQHPASAKYDGMPKSAIAAGCVDLVLPPEGIAREIVRLIRDPYLREPHEQSAPLPARGDAGHLQRIFALLKKATRADFTCYKKTTLTRRIQRRMVLHKMKRLADYAKRLERDPSEVQALHQDLLINVTSFFRDPDTFEALSREVFPRILRERSADVPVRVWVPGCATGEEAYSIAMCLLESLSDLPSHPLIQVFATDLSATAIEKARAGVYLENVATAVSPERLGRFFVKVDGLYQVSKSVRDLVVFAQQDLTRDPPFAKLDLVCCRNVLIYLEPSLQKKVLATFHYALSSSGFLMLGKSETVGASSELFAQLDNEHKIYSKVATAHPLVLGLPVAPFAGEKPQRGRPAPALPRMERRSDVEREAERLLLNRYAPASVLVDEKEEVFHFRGDTETYLGHAQGAASFHLMKMARKGLVPELRGLLEEARATGAAQRKTGLLLRHRGQSRRVSLEVVPIKDPASGGRCVLVLFEADGPEKPREEPPPAVPRGEKAQRRRIAELEQELQGLRHYHHAVEEEHAASQEELQSANEEILSSNEELQSVNEELQTTKEELESSNEELTTLNEELQNRNRELHRLNDDLDNFLTSTTLPKLMLGRDLVVRRFTPVAGKLLNLIPADVGRPLGHVRLGFEVPELEPLILAVMDTAIPAERELQDQEGRWWRLHVRPYRTRENKIDGAVLVLVDIDVLKYSLQVLDEAREFAEAMVDTVRGPLLVLDTDLRVRRANRSFYERFRVSPQETKGAYFLELDNRQWDIPALRTQLEQVLPRDNAFEDFVVEHDFPSIGRRTLKLNGRKLRRRTGAEEMILLAIEDQTEAFRMEAARAELLRHTQEAAGAAEAASRLKDEFVAVASHELRGPLNRMVGWVHLLIGGGLDETTAARALEAIDRSAKDQTRLVDELLDVSRIMTGKLRLSMGLVDLLPIVDAAMESARAAAFAKGVNLGYATGVGAESVLGDADRLQQVVWNLLSNAIKFTPKGGRVEVWVGRTGSQVQLEVSDTGRGIAPGFLPHVFEQFRQADSSPSRSEAGLGLGLTIVRQLVEMHGGSVTADSAGEGHGATFVVSLPVPTTPPVELPAVEREAEPRRMAWAGALRDLRVLVVEDDPENRELLRTLLEQCGANVRVTAWVEEALSAFEREVPDILLSDIGLPGQDAYDLIRAIRKRPPERGGRVPAVAITAYATAEDREKTAAAGFDEYVAKPAEPGELVSKLAALAGRTGHS